MVKRLLYALLLLLAGFIGNTSCKRSTVDNEPSVSDSSYFSIRYFIKDQIQAYYGMPFSLYRVAHLNGKVDSTLVNFLNMDWTSILSTFSATDISAKKFLGKYDFYMSDDETTGNRGYTYTAKDPNVFTRMLQINTDPSNNLITSIYIETSKQDFFGNKKQKLLYIPMRIIQIQESEGSLIGKARNLRVDYRFMQEDEVEQF